MMKLPKGITARGDKFRVSIQVDGARRTATCATLEEALARADQMRNGLEELAESDNWTIRQALDNYVEGHLYPGDFSENTITQYTNRVDCLVDFFGKEKTLDEFTAKDLVAYSSAMRKDRRMVASTVNQDLTILGTIMRHARKMGGMVKDVPEKPRFKQKAKEPRYLTHEQEDLILSYFDHLGDDEMMDIVAVLIDTGLRIGCEVLSLHPRYVDLRAGTVSIWKSKSTVPRKIPLTDRAASILRRRMLAAGRDKNPFGGITYHQAQTRWKAMKEALGQGKNRDWTLHICRHTFCTRLTAGGIDLRTVQTLAGHRNIKTTMNYAHFVPDNMFRALEVLQSRPEEAPRLQAIK